MLFSPFLQRNTEGPIDGLIVLGAGNSPGGVQEGTIANAEHASEYLKMGLGRFVVATGFGPSPKTEYPVSEAQAIADTIESRGLDVPIYLEESSVCTFDNMGNIPVTFIKADIVIKDAHFGVVAQARHAKRAILIARYVMPNTHLTPLAVDHGESRINDLRERVQYALTRAAFRGLDSEDPDSFLIARERYDKYILAPKTIDKICKSTTG